MAVVLNRTTKQLIQSANTPDFPTADWIINPDLSAITGQPIKYWLISGDVVSLATPAEQAVIDAAIQATRDTANRDEEKLTYDQRRVFRAIVELMIEEFNTLRTIEGLPDRTIAQARTAILSKIDNL